MFPAMIVALLQLAVLMFQPQYLLGQIKKYCGSGYIEKQKPFFVKLFYYQFNKELKQNLELRNI